MAQNLSSVVSGIQGMSTLFKMKHEDLPEGKTLEELPLPTLTGIASGAFDAIGKFAEGTFSVEGEDTSVETKKYTDGSVAFSTVQRGTYGLKGNLHNVASLVMEHVLGMETVAGESGSDGIIGEHASLKYTDASGFIGAAAFYIQFDTSSEYEGILIPNTSVASKLMLAGDSIDNAQIELTLTLAEAPEKVIVGSSERDYTDIYKGTQYVLIKKK